jgi:hypothetical protein
MIPLGLEARTLVLAGRVAFRPSEADRFRILAMLLGGARGSHRIGSAGFDSRLFSNDAAGRVLRFVRPRANRPS